jgi:hypothetical protein
MSQNIPGSYGSAEYSVVDLLIYGRADTYAAVAWIVDAG